MSLEIVSEEKNEIMSVRKLQRTVASYSNIQLSVSIEDSLVLFVKGKFDNVDLKNLASVLQEANGDGKLNTVLCVYGKKQNYCARDITHRYNPRESLYMTKTGHFFLIGFRRMQRVISVIEELQHLVSRQHILFSICTSGAL